MALACGGACGPLAFAGLRRAPSARTIARLMTTGRDALSKAEALTIAMIEDGVPALVEARAAVAEFQTMIRKKAGAELDAWTDRARTGLLASFANGVSKDRAAVAAAITNIWSNGPTEDQITRLKLIKRQMGMGARNSTFLKRDLSESTDKRLHQVCVRVRIARRNTS
jgi:transposase